MGFEQVMHGFDNIFWAIATEFLFESLHEEGSLSLNSVRSLFKRGLLDLAGAEAESEILLAWFRIYFFASTDTSMVRMLADTYALYEIKPSIRGTNILDFWTRGMGVDALRIMVRLGGRITADDLQEWDADGAPLSHIMFYCLGNDLSHSSGQLSSEEAWNLLIRELIAAGADLHARQDFYGCQALTPFLAAVIGIIEAISPQTVGRAVHRSQDFRYLWRKIIETLGGCGLDLDAFGRMEGSDGRADNGVKIRFKTSHQAVRLERIHYGPDVEDWWLEWDFELSNEDLVGEFWQMAETPSQSMPGAWPESDWYSDTDSDIDSVINGEACQYE